ncbi:MAG: AMP-binding protein, partial [Microbacteriaceae bacterium]
MTRELRAVGAGDIRRALAAALDGSGPAVYAGEAPADLPATVPRRVALVVGSSGSTGRPKRVALSADAILASAAAADAALGGPGQWLLCLPPTYIAGLNVLARSLAAGTTPIAMPAGRFTAEGFAAASALLDDPVRYVSLVPVQLARLLDSAAGTAALRGFRRVLLGGQATPPGLRARAAEAGVAVTTSYGSSETSGGCVYDGVPLGPVRVRVEDGELLVAGPVLAEGYLGEPERSAAVFVTRGGARWYRTGDAGSVDADGRVLVAGRLDDVIVSGGVNVALGAVEAAVRALPGLGDAVVIGQADAEWGQVPVVVTSAAAELAAVRAGVAERLGRAA